MAKQKFRREIVRGIQAAVRWAVCFTAPVLVAGAAPPGEQTGAPEAPKTDPRYESLRWDEPHLRMLRSGELFQAGKYREAAAEARTALDLQIKTHGPDEIKTAIAHSNLGLFQKEMGELDAAETHLRRAVEIYRNKAGENDPYYALALTNLASLLHDRGQFAEARALLERVVAIQTEAQGEFHLDTALALNNLGELQKELGDFAEARKCHERALEIQRVILDPQDEDLATSLYNLGTLLRDLQDYATAERMLTESLDIRRKTLGDEHPLVAGTLSGLGLLADAHGDRPSAQRYFEQSLAVRQECFGESHPAVAESLNNLGMLLRDVGRYEEAVQYCRRACAIRSEVFGESHPDTAVGFTNLASVYAAMGRWDEAVATWEQSRRILRRHIARVLPALSAHEQLQFLRHGYAPDLQVALSAAFARPDDERVVSKSAEWAINGKAIALEVLSQRARLIRAKNSEDVQLIDRLLSLRTQAAVLSMRIPTIAQRAAHLEELASLAREERDLTQRLGLRDMSETAADPWMSLDAVRRSLPDGARLIEIVRTSRHDFTEAATPQRRLPLRYGAWIIPPPGSDAVRFIDLGDAETIEREIADFLDTLADAETSLRVRGPVASEEVIRQSLTPLVERLLTPIRREAGDSTRWVISPDAALWLVPWETLPLGEGRYAVENFSFSYVPSGRELHVPEPTNSAQPALVIADPDFDAALTTADVAVEPAAKPDSSAPPTKRLWRRLPYSGEEARRVEPALTALTGIAPQVFTGADAVEGRVKSAHDPAVLLLSTHGFYSRELASDETQSDSTYDVNPLLQCGLVFAGANRDAGRRTSPDADDGYLTGAEIVGLSFEGTDLVLLSACETAGGKVETGEGVAGLRQAFHLAGARTVLAGLWKVADRETADLTATFLEELAQGRGKADAWRRAQLHEIERLRANQGAAHPLYWAAFTVSGAAGRADIGRPR